MVVTFPHADGLHVDGECRPLLMMPPTGDDNTVTTNEDITYVFAVADFHGQLQ